MLRLVSVNIRKICTSACFWVCVLLTLLLCLTASVYTPIQASSITVLSIITKLSRLDLEASTQFSAYEIFIAYRNGYFPMFCSMLAIFPFINLLSTQRESKMQRYFIIRLGRNSYALGQVLSLLISGALTVLLGVLVYGAIVWAYFPHIDDYATDIAQIYLDTLYVAPWAQHLFHKGGLAALVAIHIICLIMYTFCCCSTGVFITAITHNRYLILTIPFFMQYLFNQLSSALISQAYADITNPKEWLAQIAQILSPEAVRNLLWSTGVDVILSCILHFGILLISCVLFTWIGNRRIDAGDF